MAISTATAIVGSSLLGAGASLIGGKKSSKAQQQAADQAMEMERLGIEEQRRQYDLSRADMAPWREAGAGALARMVTGVNDGSLLDAPNPATYRNDPGYQFGLEEGVRTADRSAAAAGTLNSGGTLKALTRYGQGYADQFGYQRVKADQNDRWNRLAGLAGVGQTATTATASLGANAAGQIQSGLNNVANSRLQQGNARASGYANMAQGMNNALSSVNSALTLNKVLGSANPSIMTTTAPNTTNLANWDFLNNTFR